MFWIMVFTFIFYGSPLSAKGKVESNKDKVLNRALAENALFKCSAHKSFESSQQGKKLDQEIEKACASEIKTLSRWYQGTTIKSISKKLIANGKRSAFAKQKSL